GGADVAALVDIARARGPGRFYAGMRSNWGSAYEVGQVPVYVTLLNEGTEGVGFIRPTWSLSSPFEYRFTDTNPSHYDLFDVRYLILDASKTPPVPAERVAERGRHVLWERPDTGYVDLVDVLPPITADRTNLGLPGEDWFRSNRPAPCHRSRPTGRPSAFAERTGSVRTCRPGVRTPASPSRGSRRPKPP